MLKSLIIVYLGSANGIDFGLAVGSVDTALTRGESENRK